MSVKRIYEYTASPVIELAIRHGDIQYNCTNCLKNRGLTSNSIIQGQFDHSSENLKCSCYISTATTTNHQAKL